MYEQLYKKAILLVFFCYRIFLLVFFYVRLQSQWKKPCFFFSHTVFRGDRCYVSKENTMRKKTDAGNTIIKTQLHKFMASCNFQLNTSTHQHSIMTIYQTECCCNIALAFSLSVEHCALFFCSLVFTNRYLCNDKSDFCEQK